jgi:beta-N-acetylhexosaminidase
MTQRQQMAQLLLVAFQGTAMNPDLRSLVGDTGVGDTAVGGVVFYASNIESAEQTSQLTAAVSRAAAHDWIKPLIALDQEGGTVVRFAAFGDEIPSAMAVGATASPELARRAGVAVASALREAGFSMNFAPVLDVAAGPNRSLDRRRFSDDAAAVASLGAAVIAGHREAGVVAVAKHFPGHGDSSVDAHETLPVNTASAATLWRRDLAPFRAAIDQGLEAIMTAHIRVPSLAENGSVPATMSHRVLADVLRGDLRFDGVIISDEIRMKASRGRIGAPEAAIRSVVAGADMIVVASFPRERDAIFEALLAARTSGRLSEERVRGALRRILRLKYRIAHDAPPPAPRSDASVLREIAARAVTLTGNANCIVPLAAEQLDARLLYVGPRSAISDVLRNVTRVAWGGERAGDTEQRVADALRADPRVIVFAADTPHDLDLARRVRLRVPRTPLILLWSGDPYALRDGPPADAFILTYGRHPEAVRTAMRVLTGEAPAEGRLPVHVSRALNSGNRCARYVPRLPM